MSYHSTHILGLRKSAYCFCERGIEVDTKVEHESWVVLYALCIFNQVVMNKYGGGLHCTEVQHSGKMGVNIGYFGPKNSDGGASVIRMISEKL